MIKYISKLNKISTNMFLVSKIYNQEIYKNEDSIKKLEERLDFALLTVTKRAWVYSVMLSFEATDFQNEVQDNQALYQNLLDACKLENNEPFLNLPSLVKICQYIEENIKDEKVSHFLEKANAIPSIIEEIDIDSYEDIAFPISKEVEREFYMDSHKIVATENSFDDKQKKNIMLNMTSFYTLISAYQGMFFFGDAQKSILQLAKSLAGIESLDTSEIEKIKNENQLIAPLFDDIIAKRTSFYHAIPKEAETLLENVTDYDFDILKAISFLLDEDIVIENEISDEQFLKILTHNFENYNEPNMVHFLTIFNLLPNVTGKEFEEEIDPEVLQAEMVEAIEQENISDLKQLVEKGGNVNDIIPNKGSILLIATKIKNLEIINFLITKGANPFYTVGEFQAPLVYAIKINEPKLASLFLSVSPDGQLSSLDASELTPLLENFKDKSLIFKMLQMGLNLDLFALYSWQTDKNWIIDFLNDLDTHSKEELQSKFSKTLDHLKKWDQKAYSSLANALNLETESSVTSSDQEVIEFKDSNKENEIILEEVLKQTSYCLKAKVITTSKQAAQIEILGLYQAKGHEVKSYSKGSVVDITYVPERNNSKPPEEDRWQYKRELGHFFLNADQTYFFFQDPNLDETSFFAVKDEGNIEFKVNLFLSDNKESYYLNNRSIKNAKKDLTDYDLYEFVMGILFKKGYLNNKLIIKASENINEFNLMKLYAVSLNEDEKFELYEELINIYTEEFTRNTLFLLETISCSFKDEKRQFDSLFNLLNYEYTKENFGQFAKAQLARLCENTNFTSNSNMDLLWDFIFDYLKNDRFKEFLNHEALELVFRASKEDSKKALIPKMIEESLAEIQKNPYFNFSKIHVVLSEREYLSPQDLLSYIQDLEKNVSNPLNNLCESITPALKFLNQQPEIEKEEIKRIAKFYNAKYERRVDPQIKEQLKDLADELFNSRDTIYFTAAKNEVKKLESMIRNGFDVNTPAQGNYTGLMVASQEGFLEVAKLLIENGANVNARNDNGAFAIDFARRNENKEIEELLLANGSKTYEYVLSERVLLDSVPVDERNGMSDEEFINFYLEKIYPELDDYDIDGDDETDEEIVDITRLILKFGLKFDEDEELLDLIGEEDFDQLFKDAIKKRESS